MTDHRAAFCLWGEKCRLFKACQHSVDEDQARFCPTHQGPYCGRFIPKQDQVDTPSSSGEGKSSQEV